jgi:hypothetical protein
MPPVSMRAGSLGTRVMGPRPPSPSSRSPAARVGVLVSTPH